MVANMKVGKMDGFCVGEPWNARAIADGIGFTAITTQQIWKDHPEKVLAFTEEFATKNPKTVKAVMRAVLEASQWNDKLENRAADGRGRRRSRSTSTPPRRSSSAGMLGDYDYGDGRKEKDKYYMTFFDRQTNFPLKSHGVVVAHASSGAGAWSRRRPTTRASSTACTGPTSSARWRRRWASRRRGRT